MIWWEVIKCLEGVSGVRVEGDTIGGGGIKIFKGMDGSLIVSMGRSLVILCKKGECWGHIWSCTSRQPINTTYDALIHLRSPFQIRVIFGRRSNGVYWKARPVGGHGRRGVEFVNGEEMGRKFSERGLA